MHADTERFSAVVAWPSSSVRPPAFRSASGHVPGSLVGGRYRLLHCCGGGQALEFWHGQDVVTDREVGLTLLIGDHDRFVDVDEVFARTVWMCGTNTPALARILDMVEMGHGAGVVVAEWQPSCSLATAATAVPSRSEAARSARPLTEAMRAAHRVGGVLHLDAPGRLRVGDHGQLYLAFPGTLPYADRFTDVRGLASALRGLVTGGAGIGAPAW